MTVYFQHVGEKGGGRDFPRTIGTRKAGLCRFNWYDIESYLQNLDASERNVLQQKIETQAPDGFQIWGIPSGARSVLRSLAVGDFLLLLESHTRGGTFYYAGRVICKPSMECFDLSKHLWGEQRFPLILFLSGDMTDYSYNSFCNDFGFAENWHPAGKTYRLLPSRLDESRFDNENDFIKHVLGFIPQVNSK